MNILIYGLCALTAAACAVLLWRAHSGRRSKLLFWSGACFAVLTVGNALLIVDRVLLPGTDMSTWRLAVSLLAVALLIYGLVMEDGS